MIALFLNLLPAWRMQGGLVPVLVEGFDRAEAAAQIDLTPLPCSRERAWEGLLEMEGEFRHIRSVRRTDEARGGKVGGAVTGGPGARLLSGPAVEVPVGGLAQGGAS